MAITRQYWLWELASKISLVITIVANSFIYAKAHTATDPILSAEKFIISSSFASKQNTYFISINVTPLPQSLSARTSDALQLVQQGIKLYQAEKFFESVKILQQAIQIFQTQQQQLNQAQALNYLALVYQELGQRSPANTAISESLQLLQQESNRDNTHYLSVLAQALNTQGQLQLAVGQSEKALQTWQQATTIYAQLGDQSGIIGSQINQAQALQALGLYQSALIKLTSVKQTLQKESDSQLKATGLRSLGNILRLVGDLKQSEEVLQQSLVVARRSQSSQDESAALLSLGNTVRAQQETEAALIIYQQAAASATTSSLKIEAELNQLSLLVETQQWSNAQALLPKIEALLANVPISRTAVYTRINLAQSLICLKQQGKNQQGDRSSPIFQQCAIAENQIAKGEKRRETVLGWSEIAKLVASAVQQARTLQDQRAEAHALGYLGGLYQQSGQWSTAQDLTEQALFLAQAIDAPDIAYRWQWQLGRIFKATGKTTEAIASYTEAVNLLKSLRSDLVTINSQVQLSFRDSVEPVYRELVSLLLASGSNKTSQKNLSQALEVIESLQVAELENFFRQACLDTQPIKIDQIDRTAAVIYPIILSDRLEVIVSLPNQLLRHYTISVNQKQVDSTTTRLRQLLVQRLSSQSLPLSQEVYNWLIRPVKTDLVQTKVKTLVFVLDGVLRNIPVAALHDGNQYLLEKYAIALTPGLALLESQPLIPKQLTALTAGISQSNQGFPALTYVEPELKQIASQIPGKVLLNQNFTNKTLQEEIGKTPFPIVHLATHGQFSSQAEETYILTWNDRINVEELNNILRRTSVRQSTPIELLVLSACETAKGDKRAALGLAGVAVRAGARSTLATLWAVEDEVTASFMSRFYQELGKLSVTKAEALRQAQLSILQNPKYKQRPYYWAPYVLVGNWF